MEQNPAALALREVLPQVNRKVDEWNRAIEIHQSVAAEFPEITSEAESASAADRAKEAKLLIDEIEAARKAAVAPLKEVTSQIDALCREPRNALELVRTAYRNKLSVWAAKLRAQAEEKAWKLREEALAEQRREEAERRKAAEEKRSIDEAAAREARQRARDLEAQADAAVADAQVVKSPRSLGGSTAKAVWKWRVTDIQALAAARPEFVQPASASLDAAAKIAAQTKTQPLVLPGVEWYEDTEVRLR